MKRFLVFWLLASIICAIAGAALFLLLCFTYWKFPEITLGGLRAWFGFSVFLGLFLVCYALGSIIED